MEDDPGIFWAAEVVESAQEIDSVSHGGDAGKNKEEGWQVGNGIENSG